VQSSPTLSTARAARIGAIPRPREQGDGVSLFRALSSEGWP